MSFLSAAVCPSFVPGLFGPAFGLLLLSPSMADRSHTRDGLKSFLPWLLHIPQRAGPTSRRDPLKHHRRRSSNQPLRRPRRGCFWVAPPGGPFWCALDWATQTTHRIEPLVRFLVTRLSAAATTLGVPRQSVLPLWIASSPALARQTQHDLPRTHPASAWRDRCFELPLGSAQAMIPPLCDDPGLRDYLACIPQQPRDGSHRGRPSPSWAPGQH